jgi:hypothetical protein
MGILSGVVKNPIAVPTFRFYQSVDNQLDNPVGHKNNRSRMGRTQSNFVEQMIKRIVGHVLPPNARPELLGAAARFTASAASRC